MTIRPATRDDIETIAGIKTAWCRATPYMPVLHSPEEDRNFVERMIGSQDVLVAEQHDAVVGFIAHEHAEIDQLYLAENARGKGIGTTLVDQMKARADTLKLWCFQANSGARQFYEREGFVMGHMTDGAANEEHLPDIRYIWRAVS